MWSSIATAPNSRDAVTVSRSGEMNKLVRIPAALLMKSAKLDEYAKLLPYTGPLASVRLVDLGRDEWLLAGLVPQTRLEAVATRLP